MEHQVQNDGKNDADYDTGYDREEELKTPFLHKYVAGEFSQERDSLPKYQQ